MFLNRRLHFAAVYLALAAMMLRAMIPAGWMPQAPSQHASLFVICTTQGMQQVTLGDDGKPLPAQQQHQQDSDANHAVCPFAVAGAHNAPPLAASALPAPSLTFAFLAVPDAAAAPRESRPYAPHAARAPPAFA
jgi:hypothetical protein